MRKKCGINAEKVLNAIEADSFIKTYEIADQIQLSQRTVENAIAKLKEEGFLKRIGSRKSGHWDVLE
ncbi:MAG: HTH domain-containing protein [Candidatus Omnitrophica bacterium]|nr:HTH domain-containing protein [Candidatus Omnitrophota bacterium]